MNKILFLSLLLLLPLFLGGIFYDDAYADTSYTQLTEISNGTLAAIGDTDLFGYDVENIGDLDGNGEDDFATFNFHDLIVLDRDGKTDPVGSISVIFMNADGSPLGVQKISIDNSTSDVTGTLGDYDAVITDFNTQNGIGQNFGGAAGCLTDTAYGPSNVWFREGKAIEEIAYLGVRDIVGGTVGDHAVLALGVSGSDFNGEDSGGVILIEIDTDGTVLSCNILGSGSNVDIAFTNPGIGRGDDWTYFGWPIISTDVDGDGTLDLVLGQDDDYGGETLNGLPTLYASSSSDDGDDDPYDTDPRYFANWYGNRTLGIITDNNTPKKSDVVACSGVYDETCQPEIWVGTTDLVVLLLNDDGTVKSNTLLDAGAFGMDGSIRWLETGSTIDGEGKIAISGNACGSFQSSAVFILDLDTDGTLLSSFEFSDEYIDANYPSFGLSLDTNTLDGCPSAFGSGLAPLTDLDSDGVDDILIGNEQNAGSGAYVTYLNSDGSIKDMNKIPFPTGTATNFSHGNAFWKVNGTEILMFMGAHEYPNNNFGGAVFVYALEYFASLIDSVIGNSSCADCIPPTFGMNDNNKLIVSDGFNFNGISTNVIDFHTPYPLIEVETNKTNTVTLKIYENNGVRNIWIVQLGLGMPDVGSPLNDAQTLVELWLDETDIEEIIKIDKNNLVDIINATTTIVNCGDVAIDCLEVSVDYVYRDQPKYNIMAINAVDFSRNSQTNYMNDGVLVVGDSINVPPTQDVTVSKAGKLYPQKAGIVELTLVDYKTDLWQDLYGFMWRTNGYGPYLLDVLPLPIQQPDKITDIMTRQNSNFADIVKFEQDRAIIHFDASLIHQEIEPFIPSNNVITYHKDESRATKLASEAARAEEMKVYLESTDYAPLLVKEPNLTTGYQQRELESQFSIESVSKQPYVMVNLLNSVLTISGNVGLVDKDVPVIIKRTYDGENRKFSVPVQRDGSFYTALLTENYDELTITHNGSQLYTDWN